MNDRMRIFHDYCEEGGFLDLFEMLTNVHLIFKIADCRDYTERGWNAFLAKVESMEAAQEFIKKNHEQGYHYQVVNVQTMKMEHYTCPSDGILVDAKVKKEEDRITALHNAEQEWERQEAIFYNKYGREMSDTERKVFMPTRLLKQYFPVVSRQEGYGND